VKANVDLNCVKLFPSFCSFAFAATQPTPVEHAYEKCMNVLRRENFLFSLLYWLIIPLYLFLKVICENDKPAPKEVEIYEGYHQPNFYEEWSRLEDI
jgi:hypothetical protein